MEVGRDPRVLAIPPHTLGYAGSSYLFQLRTTYGSETANAANATSEKSEPAARMIPSNQPTVILAANWNLLVSFTTAPTIVPFRIRGAVGTFPT